MGAGATGSLGRGLQVHSDDTFRSWEPGTSASNMVFTPLICRTRWEGVAVTAWLDSY